MVAELFDAWMAAARLASLFGKVTSTSAVPAIGVIVRLPSSPDAVSSSAGRRSLATTASATSMSFSVSVEVPSSPWLAIAGWDAKMVSAGEARTSIRTVAR